MGDYADHMTEHLRLSLLRILDKGGRAGNESLLTDAMRSLGFTVGRDKVKTELAWLGDQGLVRNEDVSGLMVATITGRGEEVAQGIVTVPGVRRPSAA